MIAQVYLGYPPWNIIEEIKRRRGKNFIYAYSINNNECRFKANLFDKNIKYTNEDGNVQNPFVLCSDISDIQNLGKIEDRSGTINTILEYSFYNCQNLSSVDIKNTLSVLENAFNGCSSISYVNFNKVKYLENQAFQGCFNLQNFSSLCILDIGSETFYNCSQISSIEIPQVSSIGNAAFANCSSLVSLSVSQDNDNFEFLDENNVIGKDGIVLIDKTNNKILWGSIQKCQNLNVPSYITHIETHAFMGCKNLSVLDFGTERTTIPTISMNATQNAFEPISCYIPSMLYDDWSNQNDWKLLIQNNHVVLIAHTDIGILTYFPNQDYMEPETPSEYHTVQFFVDMVQYGDIQTVEHGHSATKPSDPTKTGYTFQNWDKSDEVLNYVTQDLSVNAVFQVNSHTVTFKDWNDSIISSKTEKYGSSVTYPVHPERTDYDSNGWDPASISFMPDNDVIVSALYKIKQYYVKFIDDAGKADFIESEKYSKKYEIHSSLAYPESYPQVSCKVGYNYTLEPEAITDLTTDTSVYLRSLGKGPEILKIEISGNTLSNSVRLNDVNYTLSDYNFALIDKGNGLSSLDIYEADLTTEDYILSDATSAFVNINDKLHSIEFIEYRNLTSIDDMANGCSSLTGVSLTELTAIETADRMFKDCVNLTHLSIPENINVIQRLNDENVFGNCGCLSSIWYLGHLSTYQENDVLSTAFGQAEFLCVDIENLNVYSTLKGGLYGNNEKYLITIPGNIVTLYFDTSDRPGATSGIKDNLKYYESGQKIGNLQEPYLNGYELCALTHGWVYENRITPLTNVDIIENDTTCYVSMQAKQYFIKYFPNSGSIGQSYSPQYTIEMTVELPTQVTRTDYNFAGWYDNEELSGESVIEIPKGNTGDKNFYAKWSEISCTLNAIVNTETYDAQGIHVSENDPTGGTILRTGRFTIHGSYTLTAIPSDGFEFKYWNDTSSTSTTRTVKLDNDTTLSATFNSKNQSMSEYFNICVDVPEIWQATVTGIKGDISGIVKYMDIPETFNF